MPKEPKQELTTELLRKLLGSINLKDLEDKEMSGTERKEYCAAIFAILPRLEKDIQRALYNQLMFSSNQADTWDRVVFGRGTFNGLALLLDHWKSAASEHLESAKPKEEFDKSEVINQL